MCIVQKHLPSKLNRACPKKGLHKNQKKVAGIPSKIWNWSSWWWQRKEAELGKGFSPLPTCVGTSFWVLCKLTLNLPQDSKIQPSPFLNLPWWGWSTSASLHPLFHPSWQKRQRESRVKDIEDGINSPYPSFFITPGQEDKKMTISPLHPRVIQPNLIMFFSIPIYFSSSWPGRQRGRPLQPILTFTTVAPKGPSTDPPRPIGSANIQGHVQIRTLNHISRL